MTNLWAPGSAAADSLDRHTKQAVEKAVWVSAKGIKRSSNTLTDPEKCARATLLKIKEHQDLIRSQIASLPINLPPSYAGLYDPLADRTSKKPSADFETTLIASLRTPHDPTNSAPTAPLLQNLSQSNTSGTLIRETEQKLAHIEAYDTLSAKTISNWEEDLGVTLASARKEAKAQKLAFAAARTALAAHNKSRQSSSSKASPVASPFLTNKSLPHPSPAITPSAMAPSESGPKSAPPQPFRKPSNPYAYPGPYGGGPPSAAASPTAERRGSDMFPTPATPAFMGPSPATPSTAQATPQTPKDANGDMVMGGVVEQTRDPRRRPRAGDWM